MEVWGGIECTVNRVGNEWLDQISRSGHDGRLDDLDRLAALGLDALRYPVLWERVAPVSLDTPNFAWADERLARLRHLGLRPIVGLLHHGSGPAYTSLLDPLFPELMARYAGMVAERYPWVTEYTPINEPLTTARFSGLYGLWYPHARNGRSFVRAFINQMRAIVLAMEAIRRVTPAARLIQTEDCGATFGTHATDEQVQHETQRRWLTWDLLTGNVGSRHPIYRYLVDNGVSASELHFFQERRCAPDIIGLNYYLTSDRHLDERLDVYPAQAHGGNGRINYADVEAVRVRLEGIVGHRTHLNAAWHRYRLPLAITEVHLSCTREEQLRWLDESWRAAHCARGDGADVRAVTAWALIGSFDWDTLVTRAQGHYEPGAFDIRSSTPRPTRLARMIADLANGRPLRSPTLEGAPWWQRSNRLLYTRLSSGGSVPRGQEILVTGARGTLGRAFGRAAERRGLSICRASRGDLDITNGACVDASLRTVRPWAVINAAGYVRVDAAEHDPAACHQSNVEAAVTLAAACRRHGIPFVTFSSDLVFDGLAGRPYTEADNPRPLNVYGRSKMLAEERVLALLPSALVIRTSAFFGTEDDSNFAVNVVRALRRDEHFVAASDCTVSPTYVPDLADATLDLLIDGETGLWHLANAGALSWCAFAEAIADSCDLPRGLVRPAPMEHVWGPAPRPPHSALISSRGNIMRSLEAALAAFAADIKADAEEGHQCVSL